MKIVINNTALRNNGDVALVSGLATALAAEKHRATIATPHPEHARERHQIEDLCADVTGYKRPIFQKPLLADIAALWLLLTSRKYRDCDAIIGAPGGYINSNYGFSWKMAIYRWAKILGKKTAIYSQSIGPLNARDKAVLQKMAHYLDVVVVRDQYSYNEALSAGLTKSKLLLTEDAIFLAKPDMSQKSALSQTVAISVRDWPYDGRHPGQYRNMICQLALALLTDGYRVEFISTCQGIHGYGDDSIVADAIAASLQGMYQEGYVTVIRGSLGINELKAKIATYNCVVGTRLHMCLLALMHGVPAFNVSYEAKGRECYSYLGFSDYCIDYNEPIENARHRLAGFLVDKDKIRNGLPSKMAAHHNVAQSQLTVAMERLGY